MANQSTRRAPLCVYEIDRDDRLVYCDDGYDLFVLANGGEDLRYVDVKGKILWAYVADSSTLDLYRDLVAQARRGRTVIFCLRCGSPGSFRLLEMEIALADKLGVRFLICEKTPERRGSLAFPLDESEELNHQPTVACSWCGRVNVSDQIWQDVEFAVKKSNPLEHRHLPAVSHGICPDCYKNISGVLKDRS